MLSTGRFGTRDIDRAKTFYDAIAALLGGSRVYDMANMAGYRGANGGIFVIGLPFDGEAQAGNGNMLGFEAATRATVRAVHAKALELGATCEGAPGIRGTNQDGYYGAYFRDPDGNKVTIFRFGPSDDA